MPHHAAKRSRWQFRLRTLIACVLLAGPLVAWLVAPALQQLLDPPESTAQQTAFAHAHPGLSLPASRDQCLQCHDAAAQLAATLPLSQSLSEFCLQPTGPHGRSQCATCHSASTAMLHAP